MNAADQRHMTPWLIGLCLALAIVWLIVWSGLGRGMHWLPPGRSETVPMAQQATQTGAVPPLQHYAEVWQRPLFTSNRQPAAVAADKRGASVSLDNLELTGVILAPGMHMALLTDRSDGHTVRVREGDALAHGSWSLKTLKARSAEFSNNGQVTRLLLKVPDSGASSSHDATTPSPSPYSGKPAAPARPKPSDTAQSERIQTLKKRIEQRRRQQAAHAGEH